MKRKNTPPKRLFVVCTFQIVFCILQIFLFRKNKKYFYLTRFALRCIALTAVSQQKGYTYVSRVLLRFLHFLSRENMLHIFPGFPLFQMESILVCHTCTHIQKSHQSFLQLVAFYLHVMNTKQSFIWV